MNALTAMKKAWQAYRSNAARLIIGTAILLVAIVLLVMFAFLPLLGLFVFSNPEMVFISLSLFSLFVIVALGVAGVLCAGYIRFTSQAYGITYAEASKKKRVRADEKPDFMTIFKFASREGKNAALLAYACAFALLVIFGVPYICTSSLDAVLLALPFALVFLFFVMLAPPITVFEKKPPLEAWAKSFEFALNNFPQQLLLTAVMGLIFLVLAVIPFVGPVVLFALMPWFALSKVAFYRGE
ncbi:MAG: hypothetical protein KAW41_00015 [Candidatus Diapherotrites archaeon]|nr:hypothetical protein [Candidatus Diapherotrites archaeon]